MSEQRRKPRAIQSTKGNHMSTISILVFFVSIAMAIGAVYVHQRAAQTIYDGLVIDLHASKAEMADSQRALDSAVQANQNFATNLTRALERIDSLERRSTTVDFKVPAKPFLVEIVDAPVRIPPTSKQAPRKARVQ